MAKGTMAMSRRQIAILGAIISQMNATKEEIKE